MKIIRRLGAKRIAAIARVLYENRKAEIAIVLAVVSLVREIVQAASGH